MGIDRGQRAPVVDRRDEVDRPADTPPGRWLEAAGRPGRLKPRDPDGERRTAT
jgi:hypothetical protein